MTTIIRVKRHLQDDPVEALRLECKRRKTEEDGDDLRFEKVLNFIGTVEKKDDCIAQRTLPISSIYHKRNKERANKGYKPDIQSKLRREAKIRSEENRFKVISCMRSSSDDKDTDSDSKEKSDGIAIVDVSMEKNSDSAKDVGNAEDSFVYDIYSANLEDEDFNDIYLDNVIGIEPYTSHTVFDMEYRNPEDYSEEVYDQDEDDSNDENNWRNSYPDEEGSDSEEIDVLTCEFDKFGRSDGYDLSSDEGEEKYANYENDDKKRGYYFHEAANLGGSSYAKYKMNLLDLNITNESQDAEDEEDSY